jgi:hypothetical protein
LDVSAPLPQHMRQTFAVLGFDEAIGDAVAEEL